MFYQCKVKNVFARIKYFQVKLFVQGKDGIKQAIIQYLKNLLYY